VHGEARGAPKGKQLEEEKFTTSEIEASQKKRKKAKFWGVAVKGYTNVLSSLEVTQGPRV